MDHVEKAWELRRELGRELKARREAAGLSQPQLATRTRYSRSTIATLESEAGGAVARAFWARCDGVFGTGNLFAGRWDEIQQHVQAARAAKAATVRRPGSRRSRTAGTTQLQALQLLRSGPEPPEVDDAASAYARLGWPVTREPRLELVTGTLIDVLEVPRAAGLLAMSWWLESGGAADTVRNLPAMPRPGQALAAISAGASVYFLVQAGLCPWPAGGSLPGEQAYGAAERVIGWHAHGSRVPLPPGGAGGGQPARWAHLPARGVWLASPAALLELLAKAVTITGANPPGLSLPGGVRAVPAHRSAQAPGTGAPDECAL